jgi:hypothetical protein
MADAFIIGTAIGGKVTHDFDRTELAGRVHSVFTLRRDNESWKRMVNSERS